MKILFFKKKQKQFALEIRWTWYCWKEKNKYQILGKDQWHKRFNYESRNEEISPCFF